MLDFLRCIIIFLETYNGAVTAIATVAISVFTLVLVVVTRRQAVLTKKSVEVSREALISTERAFVFLNELTAQPMSITPRGKTIQVGLLVIKPHWANNGNTPTKNMTIRLGWKDTEADTDLPDDFAYDYQTEPAVMFLGPKAFEWSKPINISGPIATSVIQDRRRFFIWGRADYWDIFPDTPPHFTKWCYRVQILNAEWPLSAPILIQPVAFGPHNGSDEDKRA